VNLIALDIRFNIILSIIFASQAIIFSSTSVSKIKLKPLVSANYYVDARYN